MCCVALCQYIEATKFRDGARGNLANEGNPPTTHTPPPLNLSLAFDPSTFNLAHLVFYFCLGSPLFVNSNSFHGFSYFLHRCGNLPFLFLRTLISLLLISLFIFIPLPHILQQQLNNTLMFDNHCFCCSYTLNSLSLYPLNDFSVLPWCVHHFCFTLGSNQLNLCFSMTDYFVFSFVLPLKLSGNIEIPELDLFFSI